MDSLTSEYELSSSFNSLPIMEIHNMDNPFKTNIVLG